MSTYVYLECLDHDPPLRSEDEVGQHLSDLPRIRDELARRDELVAEWSKERALPFVWSWPNNAARFLAGHPRCRISIRDEYGVEHPVVEDAPEDPPVSCPCSNGSRFWQEGMEHVMRCPQYEPPLTNVELRALRRLLANVTVLG
jgi:hypothetical protein